MKVSCLIFLTTIAYFISFSHQYDSPANELSLTGLQNDLSLAFDLFKELNIRQCIFFEKPQNIQKLFNSVKSFSSKYIDSVAVLNRVDLVKQLNFFNNRQYSVGVIVTDENYNELIIISEVFNAIHGSSLWSTATWFLYKQNLGSVNLGQLDIPYDCEFFIIDSDSSNYKIKEFYKVKGKSFTNDLGLHGGENSAFKITNVSLFYRRLDLNGSEILMFYDEQEKIKICENDKKGSAIDPLCQISNMFEDFSLIMNFRGKINKFSEPDIVFLPIEFHSHPATGFSVIGPIYTYKNDLFVKHPKSTLPQNYYLQCYDFATWMSIILSVIIGNIIVLFWQILNPKKKNERLIDNMFLIFESLCNQCGNDNIDDNPLKIIAIVFRIMAICLMISFGALISSFLTVEIPEMPFRNLEEFVQNGQYKLILFDGSLIEFSFRNSRHIPIYNTIYENFTQLEPPVTPDNYFNKLDRLWQLFCGDQKLSLLLGEETVYMPTNCKLYKISTSINLHYCFFFLPYGYGSQFKNAFKHSVFRYFEYGLKKKLKMNAAVQLRLLTPDKFVELFRPVEISQMIQVLSMPLVGIFLATLIIIGEMFSQNIRTKQPSREERILNISNRRVNLLKNRSRTV